MKRTVLGSLVAIGTLVFFAGLPAFGIDANGITAKIPFEFKVGKTTLPAGDYLIVREEEGHPNLLEIRSESGSPAVLVHTQPVTRKKEWAARTELQFIKVGKKEYLSQIWESDTDTGNQVWEPVARPNATTHSGTTPVTTHTVPAHKG